MLGSIRDSDLIESPVIAVTESVLLPTLCNFLKHIVPYFFEFICIGLSTGIAPGLPDSGQSMPLGLLDGHDSPLQRCIPARLVGLSDGLSPYTFGSGAIQEVVTHKAIVSVFEPIFHFTYYFLNLGQILLSNGLKFVEGFHALLGLLDRLPSLSECSQESVY